LPYLTMTVPYDASAGQLLVAFVAVQAKSPAAANPWATVAIPAGGWTEIAPLPRVCGNNLAVSIAWRIAQAGDAGSDFTWGFLTGVTGYLLPLHAAGGIVNIANADTTNPFFQVNYFCGIDSNRATAQAIGSGGNPGLSMLAFAITGDNYLTTPPG